MEKLVEILNLIAYHTLEIIEAIGNFATYLSEIHFPVV